MAKYAYEANPQLSPHFVPENSAANAVLRTRFRCRNS